MKRGSQPLFEVLCDPTAATSSKTRGVWAVVIHDWHGGEFCRRWYLTKAGAEDGLKALQEALAGSEGDVVAGMERWYGDRIQLPLGFAEWLDRWRAQESR